MTINMAEEKMMMLQVLAFLVHLILFECNKDICGLILDKNDGKLWCMRITKESIFENKSKIEMFVISC